MKKTSLLVISIILIFPQLSLSNLPVYANSDSEEDYVTMDVDKGVSIWRYKGLSKDIVIPSEIKGKPVVEIGGFAFSDMSLKSVKIPSSVTTIGFKAFNNNLLENVEIPLGIKNIGDHAFSVNNLTSVEIPSSVTTIGDAAFSANRLTSVEIPSSIKTISKAAFYGNQLTNVNIPSSVTTIGEEAFSRNKLENVEIPSSVTTIGMRAFQLNQLTSLDIPSSVTTIEESAFGFNQLTDVEIPSSVKIIGTGAFSRNKLNFVIFHGTPQLDSDYSGGPFSYQFKDNDFFKGWFEDPNLTIKWTESVSQPMTIYSEWKKLYYNVNFDSNGGSEVSAKVVLEKELLPSPATPLKDGHTFAGWYKDKELSEAWDFAKDVVTKNITLYAKWTKDEIPETSYTITFDSNGGSEVASEEVKEGEQVKTPTVPTKAGYAFAGWYKDKELSEAWDFAKDVVTKNVTLYAKWTKEETSELSYTVTFNSNGGSEVSAKEVVEGELLPSPATPVKGGNTFVGWYKDEELSEAWDFAKEVVTKNITLYAKWTKDETSKLSYTVTFDSNGGSEVSAVEVVERELLPSPATPVKDGHTFANWYKDVEHTTAWDFTKDRVVENITLYAKWTKDNTSEGGSGGSTPSYTVTFDSNGGSKVSFQTVSYRELLKAPSNPAKEGHIFAGWFKDAELTTTWDFTKDAVTENLTLYAKWNKESKECQTTFKDIDNNWAKDMVEEIASRCIIKGYPDGTFRPNDMIQRQHVVLMIERALPLTPLQEAVSFLDVPHSHPYYQQITLLQQAGIIDGSNGTFRPNAYITRAQMAKIMVLAFGLTPEGNSTFKDVDPSHWASGYIAALADHNIALGDENGNFRPNENLTRAQFTAFMYRALGL
ncbi:InlB B-repeat-containing protein [Lysinibacillus sp. NPDC058147]|uniref:InlB B-repeat-containing protein n=1 Tax=unclassified Lysinibacillus TaxID=2636778 RepID=UPI0036DA39DC